MLPTLQNISDCTQNPVVHLNEQMQNITQQWGGECFGVSAVSKTEVQGTQKFKVMNNHGQVWRISHHCGQDGPKTRWRLGLVNNLASWPGK